MRGYVVCAYQYTTIVAHPQSSTVIIINFIQTGVLTINYMAVTYSLLWWQQSSVMSLCFIIVKKRKLFEPRSLAGTHVFSKVPFGKSKSAGWQAGMSGNSLSASFSMPAAVPVEGRVYTRTWTSARRCNIAVAIGPVTGRPFPWLVQGTDRKRQSDSCVYFVLCCLEGIGLLNRRWGLKLTRTAVFFVALGTRVRGVRSKITLVGKCISGKRHFFRSLSSPIPSLITVLPH